MEIKPLYSLREVAEYFECDVRTVQRMIRDDELDAVRIGRRWFIPLTGLQARMAVWESIQMAQQYKKR